jgi:hypothetical protein
MVLSPLADVGAGHKTTVGVTSSVRMADGMGVGVGGAAVAGGGGGPWGFLATQLRPDLEPVADGGGGAGVVSDLPTLELQRPRPAGQAVVAGANSQQPAAASATATRRDTSGAAPLDQAWLSSPLAVAIFGGSGGDMAALHLAGGPRRYPTLAEDQAGSAPTLLATSPPTIIHTTSRTQCVSPGQAGVLKKWVTTPIIEGTHACHCVSLCAQCTLNSTSRSTHCVSFTRHYFPVVVKRCTF